MSNMRYCRFDAEDGWGWCPLAELKTLYPLGKVIATYAPNGALVITND